MGTGDMISNTVPVELVDIDLPLCLVDTRVSIRCVLKSWSAFSKPCLDDSQIGGYGLVVANAVEALLVLLVVETDSPSLSATASVI